jgi:hypothetical protein
MAIVQQSFHFGLNYLNHSSTTALGNSIDAMHGLSFLE